jgi:hypothetical protein
MAIIRKGDKRAEKQLARRALSSRVKEISASDYAKKKTGRLIVSKDRMSSTANANKLSISKTKDGKTKATYNDQPYEGPVSSATVRESDKTKKRLNRYGSGVVKGGKVVKGSNIAIGVAKAQQNKKKSK